MSKRNEVEGVEKKKVRIYSTPTCPYCKMAKEFLKEKGIEFEDVDVSANQDAAKEMIERSGHTGVPQIEINGKIIIGFDREKLEKELGL
ncbi:MAG: glutathione S-transferase N-terminal domain-containing protein [Candidatus Aenigmatarchaeota archaeon]|nr:MAG: glutathione S-transferase N-terminal domain-containing protein [Candidatus Aenigmarchaeota archaeon]